LDGSVPGKSAYIIENQAVGNVSHFNPEELTQTVKMIRYITHDITQQTQTDDNEFGPDA
jgi:hypothetical protein